MGHERSITVQRGDGRWVNLKTVFAGKDVGVRGATELFRAGRLRPLGGQSFSTVKTAVAAAKKRSVASPKGAGAAATRLKRARAKK